ncbi:MAG: hypothetical protein WBQ69_06250 [Gallionella sp.]
MPNFTDITGLAGIASATAATVLLLPGVARLGKPRLAILLSAVFVLVLIPFGGMPVAAYIRGMTGDLSVTTLVLVWCALLAPWCDCVKVQARHRDALLILIGLFSLVFYPMALGAGRFDPYRLGYGDPLFVAALFLLALFAWYLESALIALCIALAMLAWSAGWYESGNLWDYLLDPFVSVYALAAVITLTAKAWTKKRQHH